MVGGRSDANNFELSFITVPGNFVVTVIFAADTIQVK